LLALDVIGVARAEELVARAVVNDCATDVCVWCVTRMKNQKLTEEGGNHKSSLKKSRKLRRQKGISNIKKHVFFAPDLGNLIGMNL
jgi:hypothetical protein